MWPKKDFEAAENIDQLSPVAPVIEARDKAVIGPSITIKGELTGSEELMIQGRVQGTVDLKQNCVTIGAKAKVEADICAKAIHVEGKLTGNLFAEATIVLHPTANVVGNMKAPRVSLEDGARFRGKIDMDSRNGQRVLKPAASKNDQRASKEKSPEKEIPKRSIA
jgi:cytoskeletal protein CcmA (bactofilin family)